MEFNPILVLVVDKMERWDWLVKHALLLTEYFVIFYYIVKTIFYSDEINQVAIRKMLTILLPPNFKIDCIFKLKSSAYFPLVNNSTWSSLLKAGYIFGDM